MAIRPTDLQNALIYQTQASPVSQRAEEDPRLSQAAAQSQFVAHTEERNERVSETGDAKGSKIGVKDREAEEQQGGKGRKREKKPGDPFGVVVDEASGSDDDTPHLVDYSA